MTTSDHQATAEEAWVVLAKEAMRGTLLGYVAGPLLDDVVDELVAIYDEHRDAAGFLVVRLDDAVRRAAVDALTASDVVEATDAVELLLGVLSGSTTTEETG